MRLSLLLAGAATIVALPAAGQDKPADPGSHERRSDCPAPTQASVRAFSFHTRDGNRAVIGLATTSGSVRDTLGLLVTDVTSGGPAEKAGIEEGDRLVAIDGTELRLAAADAGDREMHGLMTRRLVRMLEKVKAGDPVELRVYTEGKVRTVKVTTAKASDLFKDEGFMRLGSSWQTGPEGARVLQLDERLGGLSKMLIDGRSESPESLDIEIPDMPLVAPMPPMPPTPPEPPDAPTAPPAPRRFIRIHAPAPPPPDAPDAPDGTEQSRTLTI